MAGWLVLLASAGYLGLLFGVAYWADRRKAAGRSVIASGTAYALSLTVYATSWTFYGSVGRAAATGVGFLPIYLGPTLTVAFWWFVLRRMLRESKRGRITSIADYVAARYGKSTGLGALVTVIAVIGSVPYLALQLKAVSTTYEVLRSAAAGGGPGGAGAGGAFPDRTALYVALLLAAFTILFGTRHLDASERHEGMVAAITVEAFVKLVAFLVVGLYVTFGMFGGLGDLVDRAAADPELARLFTMAPTQGYGEWFWLIVLSMCAFVFLPRQFQVTVVENVDERHLRTAAWMLPLYLLAINFFVLPIALAGRLLLGGSGVSPDTFVLALPLSSGHQGIALLTFLGGLSAATGMIVVETIALATMVSNSLVIPALLRFEHRRGRQLRSSSGEMGGLVLGIRRSTIVAMLLLAYGYVIVAGDAPGLVSIGLVSFAAVAQFAPAVLGGMVWRGGTRAGAYAGLLSGFAIWVYTLLLPSFTLSGWLPRGWLETGPFGIALLRPHELLGLRGFDEISHAVFWSLLVNALLYVAVSLGRRTAPTGPALTPEGLARSRAATAGPVNASIDELQVLLERFLGSADARRALLDYLREREGATAWAGDRTADTALVRHVETLLAGAVGTTSARVIVAHLIDEEPLGVGDVMEILDEASQVLASSRELERRTLELAAATAELRAANQRLTELDQLKDEFVSTVSHELRTPLTSIRSFSEILVDNLDLPAEDRERYLGIVIEEAERLTRLINDVLDLSKLTSGGGEWHVEPLDVRAVVDTTAQAVSGLFATKGATLTTDVPDDVPRVLGDRDRLVQVLQNLLSNAAKFAAPGAGQVRVKVAVHGGTVQVDVSDDGPGVPAQDRDIIFEKFRQGTTPAHRPGGTGLGLPISREIVERLGGRLWLAESDGAGATFSFTMPTTEGSLPSSVPARAEI
jgi:Na+/proline symporter/nitrogen-specific signal transduction histidine kinase